MHTPRRLLLLLLPLVACSQAVPRPRPSCTTDAKLGSICGFENPEDIAYVPSRGWLLASNLRRDGQGGFLSVLPVASTQPRQIWPPQEDGKPIRGDSGFARMTSLGEPGCGILDADLFAPHGMYVDNRDPVAPLLYVVNHGGRESIEIFTFGRRGNEDMLFWSACIELPRGTSGNDVAVASDGEVIVSNYMPTEHKRWAFLKSIVGWNTGNVLLWNLDKRWRALPNTEASAPNGVEVDAEGEWIYYSATGSGTLNRIARDGSQKSQVDVPGHPDNLTWSGANTLLLATHTSGLDFLKCLREQPCRSPWSVVEVDRQTLQLTPLVEHDGDSVGAVAAALEVGDSFYFSAVFGDRIGVMKR